MKSTLQPAFVELCKLWLIQTGAQSKQKNIVRIFKGISINLIK